MRNSRGFTLLEVLLATALLAGGLALAFSTVRSATAVSQRAGFRVAANEQMRSVLDVLRLRLQSTQPLSFEERGEGKAPVQFDGDRQRLRFVSEVPAYLGRGGPYLHELIVRPSTHGEGKELALGLTLVSAGIQVPENPARAPEVIADDLASVDIRYRGLDPDTGKLGPWIEQWPWDVHQRSPWLVSIEIKPRTGPSWPTLVVAVPQVVR